MIQKKSYGLQMMSYGCINIVHAQTSHICKNIFTELSFHNKQLHGCDIIMFHVIGANQDKLTIVVQKRF